MLRHQWERVCLDVCTLYLQVEIEYRVVFVEICDFACLIMNRENWGIVNFFYFVLKIFGTIRSGLNIFLL